MARFLSVLLWTAVFLLLLTGIDQLLVRVPASLPAHVAVADFYGDLRSRLIDLAGETLVAQSPARPANTIPAKPGTGTPPASVEKVIERRQASPLAPPPAKTAASAKPTSAQQLPASSPRYVYADDRGELHFADTLAEIPAQFRDKARRLGE